jgi:hypothetical protein
MPFWGRGALSNCERTLLTYHGIVTATASHPEEIRISEIYNLNLDIPNVPKGELC